MAMRPEEIVNLLQNVANRPDLRAVQSKQVQAIYDLLGEALAAEREACAKLCETKYAEHYDHSDYKNAGKDLAKAIRARGQSVEQRFADIANGRD